MSSANPPDNPPEAIRKLQSIPRDERMDYLAGLPRDELNEIKRLLPPEDRKKLNAHLDLKHKQAARPSLKNWLDDARAGRAANTDAMMAVLLEIRERLRDNDALWVKCLNDTNPNGGFSKKQTAVIRGLYGCYFGDHRGTEATGLDG